MSQMLETYKYSSDHPNRERRSDKIKVTVKEGWSAKSKGKPCWMSSVRSFF